MDKISSFTVNHNKLKKGLYVSRIDRDIITYDVRMKLPNAGDYLANGEMHTFEHLFATYVRNTKYKDSIIYVGPMGCRTGFYFITRDDISKTAVIKLLCDTFRFIEVFEGEIPGSTKIECGNYLEHDLDGAKRVAHDMINVLLDWTEEKMVYEQ